MCKVTIHTPVVVSADSWADFKRYIDSTYKKLDLQYELDETDGSYYLFCIDCATIAYTFHIWPLDTELPGISKEDNNAAYNDFMDNWKDHANKEIVAYVNQKQYQLIPPGRAVTNECGFFIDCKSGDNISYKTIHFPFPVDFLGGRAVNKNVQDEDYVHLWAILHDDPAWGTVTETALQGQNKVKISETATSETYPGVYLKLGTEDEKYRVDEMNYATGEATLDRDLSEEKIIGTEVRLLWPSAYNKWVPDEIRCDIGLVVQEASGVSPEWDTLIEYHHTTQLVADKKVKFTLLYRY